MSATPAEPETVDWAEILGEFRHELANVQTVGFSSAAREALVRRCGAGWGVEAERFSHRALAVEDDSEGIPVGDAPTYDVVLASGTADALARASERLLRRAVRFVCLELPDDEGADAGERIQRAISHRGGLLRLSPSQLLLTHAASDGDRIGALLRGDSAAIALPQRLCILTQRTLPPPTLRRRVGAGLRRVAGRAREPLVGRGAVRSAAVADGPTSRQSALERGLRQVGQAFDWNPPLGTEGPFVHVICRPKVLRQAIEQKRLGKIRTLMAGPNVSALPHDDDGVSVAPEVDRILFASDWIRRWFESLDASVASRAALWPAGVDLLTWCPQPEREKDVDFLILEKLDIWTVPLAEEHRALSARVQAVLEKRGYGFEVLRYGDFRQEEYADALGRCRAMIYLSLQETQSIAIAEAWAAGVPVLAWNSGRAGWRGQYFDGASSCPYGDETTRLFFRGFAEFEGALAAFRERLEGGGFQPRAYVARELSIQATTRRYLDLWRELLARS